MRSKAPAHWSASAPRRSEEHTSELQSPCNLVCRLLLSKKKTLNSSHLVISYAVFCLKKKKPSEAQHHVKHRVQQPRQYRERNVPDQNPRHILAHHRTAL